MELGSPQSEHLRAAKERKIPTALNVAGWDNLTVKGGIHELPDLLLVWNEIQRREAIDLHGVPAEQVSVVGASAFDHLFEGSPLSRAAICSAAGLDERRPYVLYLASSSFIAPHEADFVAEWAQALMAAPATAGLQLLVRPHPTNPIDPAALPSAAIVHPAGGQDPVLEAARREYAGALAHAAAVVAINTSGLIEAAVLGRPALSILDPRFAPTQERAIHFGYLLPEAGGMVQVARSLPEHIEQLAAALADPEPLAALGARFVATFVRPKGIDRSSAQLAAAALDALIATGPAPAKPDTTASLFARSVRLMVAALVALRALRRRRGR